MNGYDAGGVLPSGLTVTRNDTGKPIPVDGPGFDASELIEWLRQQVADPEARPSLDVDVEAARRLHALAEHELRWPWEHDAGFALSVLQVLAFAYSDRPGCRREWLPT